MFAPRAKAGAVPILFAGLLVAVMLEWLATLGWGLMLLLRVLLS
jgi:hypothetical protein